MNGSHIALAAIGCIMRAIPNGVRGKLRLARYATRPFRSASPVTVKDGFGNVLRCPSIQEPLAVSLFACGVYEPDTLSAILGALPEGGVYLDVGANVGALALPIAARRPQANVVCIEADPEIAALLRRNVAENGRRSITVVEALVGAQREKIAFYRAPAHKFGMGSTGPQFGEAPLLLSQRRLDDVLDELGQEHLDVVKLDIEGAEFGALKGLERRLQGPRRPTVIFEFMDWAEGRIAGQSPGDAQGWLLNRGYRLFTIGKGGLPALPIETPLTAGSIMIIAFPPETPVSLARSPA